MKICKQCNKTFSDDNVFCDICGEKLSFEKNSASMGENVKGNGRKKAIGMIAVLSVLLLVSVIANIVMYNVNHDINSRFDNILEKNAELLGKNEKYQKQIEENAEMIEENVKYQKQIENSQKVISFYQEHIGLIASDYDGVYYHKYGCEDFKGNFYAYNIELAKDKGYTACPKCFADE